MRSSASFKSEHFRKMRIQVLSAPLVNLGSTHVFQVEPVEQTHITQRLS
ncbi:hypothetical protein PCIT_a1858 [Pseudoalteromonas citrea]|uniref:Uncharacterized protein n=1 Tax=Pseudoalteromonas citrea TaxID=43655 RepID=A0AAD4AIU5_9GAMM|nr:hypothetical protein PCIT_a1858 [Pseudoalteromonas citrea]